MPTPLCTTRTRRSLSPCPNLNLIHYIYIINQKPKQVFEKFEQYEIGSIAISSITASELAFGVEKSGSLRPYILPEVQRTESESKRGYGGATPCTYPIRRNTNQSVI
ncbi:type II toxin-antitoxin system VapC family toxin, partial [Kingella kingae]|uniref:type II toxin-antitoxin system VapC family toxin n=1 Tax=Kingella kingae TaxID=504 RepID=UPI0025537F32